MLYASKATVADRRCCTRSSACWPLPAGVAGAACCDERSSFAGRDHRRRVRRQDANWAQRLAERLPGLWIPEYLREFCDRMARTPLPRGAGEILAEQQTRAKTRRWPQARDDRSTGCWLIPRRWSPRPTANCCSPTCRFTRRSLAHHATLRRDAAAGAGPAVDRRRYPARRTSGARSVSRSAAAAPAGCSAAVHDDHRRRRARWPRRARRAARPIIRLAR